MSDMLTFSSLMYNIIIALVLIVGSLGKSLLRLRLTAEVGLWKGSEKAKQELEHMLRYGRLDLLLKILKPFAIASSIMGAIALLLLYIAMITNADSPKLASASQIIANILIAFSFFLTSLVLFQDAQKVRDPKLFIEFIEKKYNKRMEKMRPSDTVSAEMKAIKENLDECKRIISEIEGTKL